jgi:hypothetical protein
MVNGSRYQHPWRIWSRQEQGWTRCVPTLRVLSGVGNFMLYQLSKEAGK